MIEISETLKAFLRILTRAGIFLAAVLLLLLLGPYFWLVLSPFVIAFIVARLLQRPIRLTQRTIKNRSAASIIWVVAVYLLLAGVVYWISSFVVGQLLNAAENYQSIAGSISGWINAAIKWVTELAESASPQLTLTIKEGAAEFTRWLTQWLGSFAESVLTGAVSFAAALPAALIYANFLIIGTYYLAKDYDSVRRSLARHTGIDRSRALCLCGDILKRGLFGYLRVQMLYTIIVFALSCVVLSLLKLPYAALIALLLAVLEFLPLFGNGTLLIPWSLICFVIGDSRMGFWLAGLFLVLMIIRKATEPRVMGSEMGLSPLLSLVGMYAGMKLYGILGLILGPIVVMLIKNIAQAHLFDSLAADISTVYMSIKNKLRSGN